MAAIAPGTHEEEEAVLFVDNLGVDIHGWFTE